MKHTEGIDGHQFSDKRWGPDARWAAHQGQVLSAYLERVRAAIDEADRTVTLALETRGPHKNLPGLLRAGTLDYLSVWVAEDVLELRRLGVDLSGVMRRFEISAEPEGRWLFEGARAMKMPGWPCSRWTKPPTSSPAGGA